VFELTPAAEQVLSRAYVPLLTQLVSVAVRQLSAVKVEALLRETGKKLAGELTRGRQMSGNLRARVAAASQLMNDELGAVTHVEENGHLMIRGAACPIAALSGTNAGVCLAMESFVGEVVGAPVRECCERNGRPRCAFEVRARKSI
jgi:predicted ArsR family transcriptional regulator